MYSAYGLPHLRKRRVSYQGDPTTESLKCKYLRRGHTVGCLSCISLTSIHTVPTTRQAASIRVTRHGDRRFVKICPITEAEALQDTGTYKPTVPALQLYQFTFHATIKMKVKVIGNRRWIRMTDAIFGPRPDLETGRPCIRWSSPLEVPSIGRPRPHVRPCRPPANDAAVGRKITVTARGNAESLHPASHSLCIFSPILFAPLLLSLDGEG